MLYVSKPARCPGSIILDLRPVCGFGCASSDGLTRCIGGGIRARLGQAPARVDRVNRDAASRKVVGVDDIYVTPMELLVAISAGPPVERPSLVGQIFSHARGWREGIGGGGRLHGGRYRRRCLSDGFRNRRCHRFCRDRVGDDGCFPYRVCVSWCSLPYRRGRLRNVQAATCRGKGGAGRVMREA